MLQFHLVRRSEPHCRSVVSNWLSNLADCHLFWNVVVGCALTVLRAEVMGQRLKFVVTAKTQPAEVDKSATHVECAAVVDPRLKTYASRAGPDPVFPWRHVGVHLGSLVLCMAAIATGVARMKMGGVNRPCQVVATLWCAHNALPLVLLMLRALHGDSVLLKCSCRWLPRLYLLLVGTVMVACLRIELW